MAEGVFVVLSDPATKKEEAYHDHYPVFIADILSIPGVKKVHSFMFGPHQVDVRPLQQFFLIFELEDVEPVRNAVAEKYGVKTSKENLRFPEVFDATTIMPTFFEYASPVIPAPNAPDTPEEKQEIVISLLSVTLDKQATFVEDYLNERLPTMIEIPNQISGQVFALSKFQIQNAIYPFIALYRNNDGKSVVSAWPKPNTNWRSIAAARATDPTIRQDGRLYGMKTRDFMFVPYVKPDPPPPPPPKPAPAAKPAAAAPAAKPAEG